MVANLFDALFGCWHTHFSFPQTVRPGTRRSRAASVTGTYVVCLNCGKEFAYDWQQMRIVSPRKVQDTAAASLEAKAS